MSTAKNSENWRKKKEEQGFKQRQYLLAEDTITAIDKIAGKTGMEKSLIITKAIEKLIESDYQGEVDTEATAQKRKVNNTARNLKNFMKVFFLSKYSQNEIDEMVAYLKKKKGEKKNILSKKFYSTLSEVPIDFPTHEEFRVFIDAFFTDK